MEIVELSQLRKHHIRTNINSQPNGMLFKDAVINAILEHPCLVSFNVFIKYGTSIHIIQNAFKEAGAKYKENIIKPVILNAVSQVVREYTIDDLKAYENAIKVLTVSSIKYALQNLGIDVVRVCLNICNKVR